MASHLQWYGSQAVRTIEGLVAGRVQNAAAVLVAATREECPVDSGDLKSTIRREYGKDNLTVNVIAGDEERGVDYAGYVHDGTSRTKANPFFTRAVLKSMPRMKNALAGKGLFG